MSTECLRWKDVQALARRLSPRVATRFLGTAHDLMGSREIIAEMLRNGRDNYGAWSQALADMAHDLDDFNTWWEVACCELDLPMGFRLPFPDVCPRCGGSKVDMAQMIPMPCNACGASGFAPIPEKPYEGFPDLPKWNLGAACLDCANQESCEGTPLAYPGCRTVKP